MKLFKRTCAESGHKFEARYDIGPPDLSLFKSINGHAGDLIESLKPKTYIKDVCIYCGKEIKK